MSTIHTGQALLPRKVIFLLLVHISVSGWINPRILMRLQILGKLNKNYLIGTRTWDLPACSIAPEPLFYIYKVYTNEWYGFKSLLHLFLTLHGHNTHCQQRGLSKYLMRYQQFASHAHWGRGTSFQDGVVAGAVFLCAPFWSVHICDYRAAWSSCTVLKSRYYLVARLF
jgi:hypothetical protein